MSGKHLLTLVRAVAESVANVLGVAPPEIVLVEEAGLGHPTIVRILYDENRIVLPDTVIEQVSNDFRKLCETLKAICPTFTGTVSKIFEGDIELLVEIIENVPAAQDLARLFKEYHGEPTVLVIYDFVRLVELHCGRHNMSTQLVDELVTSIEMLLGSALHKVIGAVLLCCLNRATGGLLRSLTDDVVRLVKKAESGLVHMPNVYTVANTYVNFINSISTFFGGVLTDLLLYSALNEKLVEMLDLSTRGPVVTVCNVCTCLQCSEVACRDMEKIVKVLVPFAVAESLVDAVHRLEELNQLLMPIPEVYRKLMLLMSTLYSLECRVHTALKKVKLVKL